MVVVDLTWIGPYLQSLIITIVPFYLSGSNGGILHEGLKFLIIHEGGIFESGAVPS